MSTTTLSADKKRQKFAKERYLKCLVEDFGIVSRACDRAGISRGTHYHWLKTDPVYAIAYAKAEEEAQEAKDRFVEVKAADSAMDGCKLMRKFILKHYGPEVLQQVLSGKYPRLFARGKA